MKDNFGRPTRNFRISITQRCNLECSYCHREGEDESRGEMTPEEISRIVALAVDLGVASVKLTGGEPLIRKDVVEIVGKIAEIDGVKDLSMTTNGILLAGYAESLFRAGLDRVNISLPTPDEVRYKEITGGEIEDVIDGIEAAIRAGLYPVKLNMVVLKGVNDEDFTVMIDFAKRKGVILQVIELEPINIDLSYYREYHQPLDDLEKELESRAEKIEVRPFMQNRRIYVLSGQRVEVIKPIENTEFCEHCTRIRLTSDGKLKPCLMRKDNLVDILTPIRTGAHREALRELFIEAIKLREPFFRRKKLEVI